MENVKLCKIFKKILHNIKWFHFIIIKIRKRNCIMLKEEKSLDLLNITIVTRAQNDINELIYIYLTVHQSKISLFALLWQPQYLSSYSLIFKKKSSDNHWLDRILYFHAFVLPLLVSCLCMMWCWFCLPLSWFYQIYIYIFFLFFHFNNTVGNCVAMGINCGLIMDKIYYHYLV